VTSGTIGSTALTVAVTVDYGDGSGPKAVPLNPDRSFSLGHIYPSGGQFLATVKAVDPAGQTTTSSILVTVVNVAPTAQIVVAPSKYPKKGPAKYQGAGSDPGAGDSLQYAWTVTIPVKATKKNKHPLPKVVAHGSGQNFSFSTKTKGTYTVTLTVTDNQGAQGKVSRTIKR
jgi:large repetitive protein